MDTRRGLFPAILVTVVRTETVEVRLVVGPPKRVMEKRPAVVSAPRVKVSGVIPDRPI
jgi:hypothetical protein